MPQSKEKKREQARLRKQRQRDKERDIVSVTTGGVTGQGVTLDVTQYPAILLALTDPNKRQKLEKITQSLKDFNQEKNVRYGVNGPTFDVVGDLLEATR